MTHKQLSENAKFLASTYTKGSKLNKIYLQISRREFIKSIVKLEWIRLTELIDVLYHNKKN